MFLDNPFKLIYDKLDSLNSKIDNLTTNPEPELLEEDITDVIGASKILNCKKGTIYNKVNKSIIPYHKKEGKLYFFKSELIEYIKTGKVKTRSEITKEVNQRLYEVKNKSFKEKTLPEAVKTFTSTAQELKEQPEEASEIASKLFADIHKDSLKK